MDRSSNQPPVGWVAGLDQKIPYDLDKLARGDQVPELWNEEGDTLVYLFPQNVGRSPSFKVHSSIFAQSASLTCLARGKDPRMQSLEQHVRNVSIGSTGLQPISPLLSDKEDTAEYGNGGLGTRVSYIEDGGADVQELHLYLPIPLNSDVTDQHSKLSPEDIDTLLLFRNLFAFLMGQSLVATPRSPSLFSIFMDVSTLLARFGFSNLDGTDFGEAASSSFGNYCDELHLADSRRSREKTIEAIVLGERLRFYPLYLEGFVHAVGKLDEIKQIQSPKYSLIHSITKSRLERGFIDLNNRLRVLYSKLEDFDFPSMWSGIANSTTSAESKVVRFKAWKAAFLEFRKFTLHFYRQKYGSWPPKANSKKNTFQESGLNRLLLKDLYTDFANLYDLLVDRTSLTTRTADLPMEPLETTDPKEMTVRALRQILSEYDRSTPPVQPPIPFDIPQLPSLKSLHLKQMDAKKEAKMRTKKLKDSDINAILMGSYTRESIQPTSWIESFMQFERRCAHGKTIEDLIDLRIGQWLFLYAVIQSLPMVIVDVADLKYTEGVEYFLCVAPWGGAPWIQHDGRTARSWFGVAGGGALVNLPPDVVRNSVEGTFRRSHCWQIAQRWIEQGGILDHRPVVEDGYENDSSVSSPHPTTYQSSSGSVIEPPQASPFIAPAVASIHAPSPRTGSPVNTVLPDNRYSFYPSLEAFPLPAGASSSLDTPVRPGSRSNPGMSFDDILKEMPRKAKGRK